MAYDTSYLNKERDLIQFHKLSLHELLDTNNIEIITKLFIKHPEIYLNQQRYLMTCYLKDSNIHMKLQNVSTLINEFEKLPLYIRILELLNEKYESDKIEDKELFENYINNKINKYFGGITNFKKYILTVSHFEKEKIIFDNIKFYIKYVNKYYEKTGLTCYRKYYLAEETVYAYFKELIK